MHRRPTREQIIKARWDIEQHLKTNPDVDTRRWLDKKDAQLHGILERMENRRKAA